jgi:hypothetical protein
MMPGIIPAANIIANTGTPSSIADSDVDRRVTAVWNFYSNFYSNQYVAQQNTGPYCN